MIDTTVAAPERATPIYPVGAARRIEKSGGRGDWFIVRDATPADNDQLMALAAACPMAGDMSLRIDRGPDFFALNRLEGERWQVGVAMVDGKVVGCVAASERSAFVNGIETRTGYAGDLKVHPDYRDTTIADALSHYAERAFVGLPPAAPVMITVLAGNRAMERRLSGPRGVPPFRKIATIRTHSIPILWARTDVKDSGIRIESAGWRDLGPMEKLWNTIAPHRQLAPAVTTSAWAEWIRAAPGLDIESYTIARSANGEMLGFLAVWDQRSFKQLTVLGYSPRMKIARVAFNALAAVIGAERLPRRGAPLSCVTIAHICVPPTRPDVLRCLVLSAYSDVRRSRCSFMNIGLDRRDPLTAGLDGLLAQPTDVNAYSVTTRRGVLPELLDSRPLHYEIALV
jgi:ribosomal protein S18 acetylase RimI-like enzyme